MSSDLSYLFALLLFPIIGIIIVAAVIYLILILTGRSKGQKQNDHSIKLFGKVVIGIAVTAFIVFIVVSYIPSRIQDQKWVSKQNECAIQTGFKNSYEARRSYSDTEHLNQQISFGRCLQ